MCATQYAIKAHSLRVNQVYGHVQFGNLTYYKSYYEDFLPIMDPLVKLPKKKLNVPFHYKPKSRLLVTVNKVNILRYSFIDGKQPLDYLDNNILIPIWNERMYYTEKSEDSLHTEKNHRFA
jgi:hypothetical protein